MSSVWWKRTDLSCTVVHKRPSDKVPKSFFCRCFYFCYYDWKVFGLSLNLELLNRSKVFND